MISSISKRRLLFKREICLLMRGDKDSETVVERTTVVGKFLDRLNYRPLRSLYKHVTNLLPSIDRLLSSDEGGLSVLRSSLLSHLSILARTFYQSSLVGYLKSDGRQIEEFKDEVERAYIKGINEREQIIQIVESILTKTNEFYNLKENLNSSWQEVYYRISLETSSDQNIRKNLALVFDKAAQFPQMSDSEGSEQMLKEQKHILQEVSDLSFQAAEICDKSQMVLQELLELSINPLVSILEDEANSASKILTQIKFRHRASEEKISDDEIAKLCDVTSWGLDDLQNFDDLISLGKELRNELASLLSDFLVFLVDIDLSIQELESLTLKRLR